MAINGALTRTGGVLITMGSTGAWDQDKIGPLCIVKMGPADYRMWYEGITFSVATKIGYATSSDGATWVKYGPNPIMAASETWETSGDTPEVSPGTVIWDPDDRIFKMWYHGGGNAPGHRAIGYATSYNGTTWTKYASNPILSKGTAGQWDDDRVHDAAVLRVSSSDYRMWYVGATTTTQAIGYATSSDGITWSKSGSNPVFQSGSAGQWDDGTIYGLKVIDRPGDGTLHAWYAADDGTIADETGTGIGYASSLNGTTWTRGPNNPVLVGTVSPHEQISDPVWAYQDGDTVKVPYYYDNFVPTPVVREHRQATVGHPATGTGPTTRTVQSTQRW